MKIYNILVLSLLISINGREYHFKELFAKMETIIVVLDQKEEKDSVKHLSFIEKSLAYIAKCMEYLQMYHLIASSLNPSQIMEESVALTKMRPHNHSTWCYAKMDLNRFDGSNAL